MVSGTTLGLHNLQLAKTNIAQDDHSLYQPITGYINLLLLLPAWNGKKKKKRGGLTQPFIGCHICLYLSVESYMSSLSMITIAYFEACWFTDCPSLHSFYNSHIEETACSGGDYTLFLKEQLETKVSSWHVAAFSSYANYGYSLKSLISPQ